MALLIGEKAAMTIAEELGIDLKHVSRLWKVLVRIFKFDMDFAGVMIRM